MGSKGEASNGGGGIVDEVGSGVPDRLKLGDAVMAIVVPQGSHGAFREQIVLDARSVVGTPSGKAHPDAATLLIKGLPARLSLDLLKLSPGQVIAATGAAGAYGGRRGAHGHRRCTRERRKAGCVAWRRYRRSKRR
jgi:NADPH:quinone reductase-like Zn-dependent oxidoreductase